MKGLNCPVGKLDGDRGDLATEFAVRSHAIKALRAHQLRTLPILAPAPITFVPRSSLNLAGRQLKV